MARISIRTRREHVIRDRRQARAIVSPVRQEIMDAVMAAGPSTIAEIAGALGRAPDGLYFHVRRLAGVGLLVECAPRRDGRRAAAVYGAPARSLRLAQEGNAREVAAVMRSVLSLARRDVLRALADGATTEGAGRELSAGRARGWLTAPQRRALLRAVRALVKRMQAGGPRAGARPFALTWAVAPCRTQRRPRRTS